MCSACLVRAAHCVQRRVPTVRGLSVQASTEGVFAQTDPFKEEGTKPSTLANTGSATQNATGTRDVCPVKGPMLHCKHGCQVTA